MIMSEKIKPGEPDAAAAGNPSEQVPVPDEFKALLRKLEEKERGS